MAYAEQTFTNLGGVQSPDASQSIQFAGSTPFAFSESTNQLLNQISQEARQKRENEIKTYNENLKTALSKASEIADGLSEQDYDEANKKSKEAIKFIYDNPQILLGKDPAKSQQFNNMLVDIASYTKLSKATKKVQDNYNDLIKKDADWNNEVNNYYLQQYQNTADPNERIKFSFTPIKNPLNDFQTMVVPKLQQNAPIETRTEVDPNDAGKLIVYQDKIFDEGVYKEAFKNYNGQYLTEEWRVKPELQQQYATPDEYIEFKAKETFIRKATSKSSVTNNVSFVEGQKNGRNEASIQGRATEGAANRANRLQLQREKADINNPSYELVKEGQYQVDRFLNGKTKPLPVLLDKYKGVIGLGVNKNDKVEQLDLGLMPDALTKTLFPTENDREIAAMYKITEPNGNVYFVKGKEVSLDKKGKVIPPSQLVTSEQKSAVKDKVIVPDTKNKYTKDILLDYTVGESQKAVEQLRNYRNANNELKAIESEPKTSSTSAEKQLDNPKVNQLLKKSYLTLKQKYPTIGTNGIAGDAAHQQRDSDHNTMDAIDIVKFGNNSTAIIGDLQKDKNVKYIIFNKQIWNPKDGWKPYTGKNPHTDHIHVSYIDDGITTTGTPLPKATKDWSKYKRK